MKHLPVIPVFLILACATLPVSGAGFTFTKIADNLSPKFSAFPDLPAINAGGTTVFRASLDAGGTGIFTSAGGPVTDVALSSGPIFNGFDNPVINSSGIVAFFGVTETGNTGIFSSAGGVITTIALSTPSPISNVSPSSTSINSGGTVAFRMSMQGGSTAIYTGSGGPTTTIALSSGPVFSIFGDGTSINAAGTVAFQANLDSGAGGGNGMFSGAGGATTTIAQSSGTTFGDIAFANTPSINEAGNVAFTAILDAGGSGVFRGAGGSTTTIVASANSIFSYFGSSPSLNSSGVVAFRAALNDNGFALYLGNSGDLTRVIGKGDDLFDSTVINLDMGSNGLNDNGQLAFTYALANGANGIAIANPVAVTEIRLGNVMLSGDEFVIEFFSDPGLTGWSIKGSATLQSWPDNLTGVSVITEPTPGNYHAVVNVNGKPSEGYFLRIER